jgi:hypothetical protein
VLIADLCGPVFQGCCWVRGHQKVEIRNLTSGDSDELSERHARRTTA